MHASTRIGPSTYLETVTLVLQIMFGDIMFSSSHLGYHRSSHMHVMPYACLRRPSTANDLSNPSDRAWRPSFTSSLVNQHLSFGRNLAQRMTDPTTITLDVDMCSAFNLPLDLEGEIPASVKSRAFSYPTLSYLIALGLT